ncbi:hypothetical protein LEMLEM_LOCUS6606, partial [Lemmus lemmus]
MQTLSLASRGNEEEGPTEGACALQSAFEDASVLIEGCAITGFMVWAGMDGGKHSSAPDPGLLSLVMEDRPSSECIRD